MKKILLGIIFAMVAFYACQDTTEGYLISENASYDPDTMFIRRNPIWELDSNRMMEKTPWASLGLQGYEGTEPIYFDVVSVTSSLGEAEAKAFREKLTIRGGGILMFPFENDAKPGFYTVSIRLSNKGYSHVLENALTFHVVE